MCAVVGWPCVFLMIGCVYCCWMDVFIVVLWLCVIFWLACVLLLLGRVYYLRLAVCFLLVECVYCFWFAVCNCYCLAL